MDKNFGNMFVFWDMMFGTYYLPNRVSEGYGLGFGQHMSASFFRQLVHPWIPAVIKEPDWPGKAVTAGLALETVEATG